MSRRIFNYLKKIIQIFRESSKAYVEDKCYLHASSLTFYTLLSIVPSLAVAFGLAKGFGFEKSLESELYKRLVEQKEVINFAIGFARSLLLQAEGSYITGIGVAFLFLFVISLFWTIEASLNAIWKVKQSRTLLRIITDYLAMMIIFPLCFVIASSLIVFITGHITQAFEHHTVLQRVTPLLYWSFRGIPLVLIWVLFSVTYIIMPNTKVRAYHAIEAAIFSGTIYYFVLIAIIKFQVGISQYNAIYGSFAALPIFLFWLQLSWLIVLFGAEIAYHSDHLSPVLKSSDERIHITKQLLTLLLTYKVIKSFEEGEKPWTLHGLSYYFGIPESVVLSSFHPLISQGMVTAIRSDNDITTFQPGREPSHLTLQSVFNASNPRIHQEVSVLLKADIEHIAKKIRHFEKDASSLKTNIFVKHL